MSFELKGTVHKIFDTAQVTDTFKKREFVLETLDGTYTQYIKFQLTQDKCGLLDNTRVGSEVNVHFNISGKEYQKGSDTLYFTNLNAWRIIEESNAPVQQNNSAPSGDVSFPEATDAPSGDDSFDDGLPF